MRLIYAVFLYAVVPFVVALEAWRHRRNPAARGLLRQRFGLAGLPSEPGCAWVHASSVGEVQAAAALVRELQRREPGLPVVISTVTPTGAQQARALFGDRVAHRYLPYDLPGAVNRFLDRLEPRIAVVLETEIWPNLYGALRRRGVPIVLASARLTDKSVRRYRRLGRLFPRALASGVAVCAQSEADAARFRAAGAPSEVVAVTGNVKFDLEIPAASIAAGRAHRRDWGETRPVWIAGSTHEGEEQAALEAHARVRVEHPSALLVLVPRHPQRFDAVRALLEEHGVRYAARSARQSPAGGDEVLLVDTLGELQTFYAAADVAFVGGSLVPVGGHNLLEPAVLGLPILSGPHTQNAADVAEVLRAAGALTIVNDAPALATAVASWFADPAAARRTGESGRSAVAANRGAVARVVERICSGLR